MIKLAISAWALLVIGIGGLIVTTGGYVPRYLAAKDGSNIGPCYGPFSCPTPESSYYGFLTSIAIFTAITVGAAILLYLDAKRNRIRTSIS